jgi:hypothetical protein
LEAVYMRILENLAKARKVYFNRIISKSIISEIIPNHYSESFPINDQLLDKLHKFVNHNPIYFKKTNVLINDIEFTSYEGDVNTFYLNAKKYDTSYQPFYPTWILSALLICERLKLGDMKCKEIIDIGSGDGRIPFCGALLGLYSIGLELDHSLTQLQRRISESTKVPFEIINADGTDYDFSNEELSRPCFIISALPEMGEMFVENIIKRIKEKRIEFFVIIFLASSVKRRFANDMSHFGWGRIMEKNNLKINDSLNLPTHWTNDNADETIYLFTKQG